MVLLTTGCDYISPFPESFRNATVTFNPVDAFSSTRWTRSKQTTLSSVSAYQRGKVLPANQCPVLFAQSLCLTALNSIKESLHYFGFNALFRPPSASLSRCCEDEKIKQQQCRQEAQYHKYFFSFFIEFRWNGRKSKRCVHFINKWQHR